MWWCECSLSIGVRSDLETRVRADDSCDAGRRVNNAQQGDPYKPSTFCFSRWRRRTVYRKAAHNVWHNMTADDPWHEAKPLPEKDEAENGVVAPLASQHHTLKYHLLGPSLTKPGQDNVDQKKVGSFLFKGLYYRLTSFRSQKSSTKPRRGRNTSTARKSKTASSRSASIASSPGNDNLNASTVLTISAAQMHTSQSSSWAGTCHRR